MRIVFFLIFLLSCSKIRDFTDNDWAYYRGDNSVSHYKSFDKINVSNVHNQANTDFTIGASGTQPNFYMEGQLIKYSYIYLD